MNLNELREAMASDATKENEKLKAEIEELKSKYKRTVKEANEVRGRLLDDCRALSNRCFALTKGSMCVFCELSEYHCKSALSFEEKILQAKKLMDGDE